ncbi:hypothetical protein B0J12DRAFT_734553 [Macrophomina phaseolina]|uniref:E3 ubiquitin-protein ligase n=1 Tax=Macrophomina phaseolina TaxID=35725 RepID=A0ABQ8GYG8_9PEZI|nr:hypothetical protein B0J12DRAFT_734553 [Macrophomina phaseolina]
MDADDRSGAGIALRGAPDEYIGERMPLSSRGTSAMQVEMTRDVIDDLLAGIRDGRAPVLHFGQNPVLEVGDSKMVLDASKEEFRNELYTTDDIEPDEGGIPEFAFHGFVDYRLVLQKASAVNEATSGADAALQTLRSNMEAIRKEKQASKLVPGLVDSDTVGMLTSASQRVHIRPDPLGLNDQDRKKRIGAGKASRGNVLGGHLVAPNASTASSPAMSAASPKPTPPTSAPQNSLSVIQKAIRVPLLHLLAMKPATLQQIVQYTRAPKDDILAVLSKIGKEQEGKWKLADKAFKELDVFKFPYKSKEDRQQAIDNARAALDRQRLEPEDKIWQKFLPEEQRGKGIILSKLGDLRVPTVAQKSATPKTMKPTQRLKSLTKKVETKKKEPRKKKSEEDVFGLAARKKVANAPAEDRREVVKKKPLKTSVGEEKDVVTERKKLMKASDDEKERPIPLKSIKRPVPESKEDGHGPVKKFKKPAQDDKEPITQGVKRKLPSDSGREVLAQNQHRVTKFSKEGTARSGAGPVPSTKAPKEVAQHEQKTSARPSAKKLPQVVSANGNPSTTGPTSTAPKKVPSRINDQKTTDTNGKTVQPKINGLPFTSTKKVSSVKHKSASSTGSPLANSDVEKSRQPLKASPASSTAAGAGTPGNSDRSLKRKANDLDNDIHKHEVTSKQRKTTHSTPLASVATTTATPPNTEKPPVKRKAEHHDSDKKQPAAKKLAATYKAAKPTQTPTPSYSGASSISSTSSSHSQHPGAGHTRPHDSPQSLHDASSASPEYVSQPLNIRRAIDLSAQFKRFYSKYYALYTSISNRKGQPPTDKEREEIHQKEAVLAGMKKEIKWLMENPQG